MKKILFVMKNAYNRGGDTRATLLIANKLAASKKFEVEILSIFKDEDAFSFYLNENISVTNLFEKPFSLRKNFWRVKKEFNKFIINNPGKIDILCNTAMGFNTFTHFAARKTKGMKVITVEHASFFDGGKIFGLAWLGRRIACKHNDSVIVLTEQDKKDYLNRFSKIKKIEKIYNPIDNQLKTSSYNKDSKKIITCGRLVKVKGYDYLIEVAKIVLKENPDWEWHIYGNGPEKEILDKKISEDHNLKNLKLKGESTSIYDEYSKYAFYVMTSRSESFGMVLVEALKTGIPALSFDCNNGPREIIRNGKNGILVDAFDIQKMAKEINLLIKDENTRIHLAKNSQYDLKKFDLETIYLQWEELLISV